MTIIRNFINEASLSRVWQHVKGVRPFALLTAFRGGDEYSYSENIDRNLVLAARIKLAGFGYFYVDGYWIENQGTPQERHVEENSIFAIGTAGKEEYFFSFIIRQLKKWDQEAALIRIKDMIGIYDSNGKLIKKLNKFLPGNMGDMYTKLRHRGKNSTFVFENEHDGLGLFGTIVNNFKEKEDMKK